MKSITVYEANDGSRWNDETKAYERDALIAEAKAFLLSLGMRDHPLGVGFGNGDGYVQQPADIRGKLLAWLKEKGANRDSDGPIGKVMWQLHCIDEQDRQWGQPYFAINPGTGKEVAL